MPAIYVNIKPEIIKWVLDQTDERKLGDKLMSNIKKWLDGTKTPTLNQIKDFSRKSYIPLGYFFLQSPPNEQIKLLEYRTVDSIKLEKPSRNLIETVSNMENVQDWVKDYRQSSDFGEVPFVGCLKDCRNTNTIVKKIYKDLDLQYGWNAKCRDARDAFTYIREKLNDCSVIVMVSGIVGQNTHRALDVNEFRAFAIVDNWAPLIFINSSDSNGAKLFSLLHEAIHIWIGESDFYNINNQKEQEHIVNNVETICNAAASDLLVPRDIFLKKWDECTEDSFDKISNLAKYFCCSKSVIAKKAFDTRMINRSCYDKAVKIYIDEYVQMKKDKRLPKGNNYNAQSYRLDKFFVRALCESISTGRTTFTEAYHLTNTNAKTFSDIAQRLGGVEW